MDEMAKMGVYALCFPSGERYVGMTTRSFALRWSEHGEKLRRGVHHCSPLQQLFDRGEGQPTFTILETWSEVDFVSTQEMKRTITQRELEWWQRFREEGYTMLNDEPTATGSVRHGELTRKAISSTIRGKHGCICPTKIHLADCSLYNDTKCKNCGDSFHSPIKSNPRTYCGDVCRDEAKVKRRRSMEEAVQRAFSIDSSLSSIAEAVGYSEVTVAKILADLGLRKQVKGDAAFKRVLGEITREELLEKISSPGGLTSLMLCYTIGESTVKKLIEHHGLNDIQPIESP